MNDLDTEKISNIRKMLNTFDGLLIAFEYYQLATNLSSLRKGQSPRELSLTVVPIEVLLKY